MQYNEMRNVEFGIKSVKQKFNTLTNVHQPWSIVYGPLTIVHRLSTNYKSACTFICSQVLFFIESIIIQMAMHESIVNKITTGIKLLIK